MSQNPWILPAKLWKQFKSVIPVHHPSPYGGRPRKDDKVVLSAIIYLLSTGIQWKALPRCFGVSPSTVHARFTAWIELDVFRRTWEKCLETLNNRGRIAWTWVSMDGAMTKSPLGGEKTGANPTDRSKIGTKRSMMTDKKGIPIGIAVSGANRHDSKLLVETLDSMPVSPPSGKKRKRNLCLDKAYDSEEIRKLVAKRKFVDHIKRRGEEIKEKRRNPKFKARRWVVERTHSWLNRFRRLIIRWEKKIDNYLSFVYLACAIIAARVL
jgi:transposase